MNSGFVEVPPETGYFWDVDEVALSAQSPWGFVPPTPPKHEFEGSGYQSPDADPCGGQRVLIADRCVRKTYLYAGAAAVGAGLLWLMFR